MKIETKHLAPYLPYKLQCAYLSVSGNYKTYEMDTQNFVGVEISDIDKPILKPMTDLFQPVDYDINNGSYFSEMGFHCDADKQFALSNPLDLTYVEVEFLLKNHFDVFKLIKKKLAYDINDLKSAI